jgi:tetratricopeptide (TPR) repeat protein
MQDSASSLPPVARAGLLMLALGLVIWAAILILRRSEQPGRLLFKWALSALVLSWMSWQMNQFTGVDANLSRLWVGLAAGFILLATWRHNITDFFARPVGSLFDGGDVEVEPQPYYSMAEAKRKRGQYAEAIAEIRRQLEKFPTDFNGQMMLATIQAEHLNDLPGAELTIQRLCAQRGHAPVNLAHAWSALADWHLKYAVDRDAARRDLQQIVEALPDTDFALAAAQRLAHLASTAQLVAAHDRPRPVVTEGPKHLGLQKTPDVRRLAEADTEGVAADYVQHLEEHPLDLEVREKLALIYADHYRRLDLATDQLEQLIAHPNSSAKKVAHWLNLLADLQVRHGADYATVQGTLERILDRLPHTSAADLARTRLSHLRLEFKSREKTAGVKLGRYEQNIGLKRAAGTPP